MRVYIAIIALISIIGLGACQSLGNDDMAQITLELTAYATQSTQLQQAIAQDATQVVLTVDAASQQFAQLSGLNGVLVATVRAGENPTPVERIAAIQGGAMSLEMLNTSDGQMRFMQVGVAGFINPSDGCFESHQQYYTLGNANVVYMTALAVNLKAGTRFAVDWFYAGQRVFQSAWTAPSDEVRRCIAVPMRITDTAFLAGDWTATLYIDGQSYSSSSFQMLN